MSPISNLVQPSEPSAQAAKRPPSYLAKTACLIGALAIEAPVQPGQWPHQPATPGTPEPWLLCSQSLAACRLAGSTCFMSFSTGESSAPFHLASEPSSVNGQ